MSMGYGAAFAETIEEDSIKKFVKKEFETFMGCAEDCKLDLEDFARNIDYDREDCDKDLLKAYDNLCNAFKKKTGLYLNVAFHSPDDGDSYDEVSGIYWNVDGMYQLTPAGKKMEKCVNRKFFVTFG